MALPPEPLADVLPNATLVVEGEVTRVEDLGAWPPLDKGGPIDGAAPCPAQRITVRVVRALRGAPASEIVATKPVGAYAVRVGVRGAFLVDASGTVLGRYGPDTYDPAEVARVIGGGA